MMQAERDSFDTYPGGFACDRRVVCSHLAQRDRVPTAGTSRRRRAGGHRRVGHDARGKAAVVVTRGKRVLTLRNFRIDPGPQVRVWLATDAGGETFEDIGALKGNKGTQQYAIPSAVDLARYDTVVFWCVPFSQSLASARLSPA